MLSYRIPASLTLIAAAAASAQVEFKPVALNGQPAPGLADITFQQVCDPVLSASGELAFSATLAGTGVTSANAQSNWIDRGSGVTLAYRSGVAAPGSSSIMGGIEGTSINASGRLAFATFFDLTSPGIALPGAIIAENSTNGDPGPIVADPANATQNLQFVTPRFPFNAEGAVAWNTLTSVTSLATATINTTSPVPGVPTGVFKFFMEPTLSDNGVIAFRALYAPTPTAANTTWTHGLFTTHSGTLQALALVGGGGPGLPAGATYRELGGAPLLDTSGNTYTWARFQGGATIANRDTGLFREQDGALVPIVLANAPVPDIAGAVFTSFDRRISLTPGGGVAFLARFTATTGADDAGIFIAEQGRPIRLCARRGQSLPGMPANSTLKVLAAPVVSSSGHLLFTAWLSGGNGQGLFAGDYNRTPTMLFRTGGTLMLPTGAETVRSFSFDHEQEQTGHAQAVGNRIALVMTFESNTSGVFTGTFGCSADFDGDGDFGTDFDIQSFFACLGGTCCQTCASADFNGDGDTGTDADIESFFRVLSGGPC